MSGSPDVFIVMAGIDYEGSDIYGVFPTEIEASAWMRNEIQAEEGVLHQFDYVKIVQFSVGNIAFGDRRSGFVRLCERWSNDYSDGWKMVEREECK